MVLIFKIFHDGGPYHIETSLLICYITQWTGFYMTGTFVMKELNHTYMQNNYLRRSLQVLFNP